MKKFLQRLIFLPALIAWVFFAPSFRAAHWITDKLGIVVPRASTWFWCNVEATDHIAHYSIYDEDFYS